MSARRVLVVRSDEGAGAMLVSAVQQYYTRPERHARVAQADSCHKALGGAIMGSNNVARGGMRSEWLLFSLRVGGRLLPRGGGMGRPVLLVDRQK